MKFDFLFFAELLDRAHHHYFNEKGESNGWDGKVFVDIGSGTGRLVIGASALHPGFSKCKGIEILKGIHNEALQKLEKCNDYRKDQDTGQASEISQTDTAGKKEDNVGEIENVVNESVDTEPLTPQMIEMQKILEQMSAEEWQELMADVEFDDNSIDDTDIEQLADKTGTENTTINNDAFQDEIEEYMEAASIEIENFSKCTKYSIQHSPRIFYSIRG